jgi:toxin-antitoxin system PIN domain toxin
LILLDTNLLVYAYAPNSPHHKVAQAWFEGVLRRPARVGLPWPTLLGFVRLMGNRHVVRQPAPPYRSWTRVQRWLELPHTWIPLPTERHQEILAGLLEGESKPDLVNDAHLAALAIEHGLTLCSTDRDFARFQGLRWENPLRDAGRSLS